MARGRKTGGRDFRKGCAGRPMGARDAVPRSFRASVRAILAEVASENPNLIRGAILRGLKAAPPKSFQYLQLAAHYLDGRPVERLEFRHLSNLSSDELQAFERLLRKAQGLQEERAGVPG